MSWLERLLGLDEDRVYKVKVVETPKFSRSGGWERASHVAQVVTALIAVCSVWLAKNQLDQANSQFKQQTKVIEAQFDFENRPYLQFVDLKLDPIGPGTYTDQNNPKNSYPAAQFSVSCSIKNHGKTPAFVSRVDFLIQDHDRRESPVIFMASPNNQKKVIENIDVFPGQLSESIPWTPFLNFEDTSKIMKLDIMSYESSVPGTKENELGAIFRFNAPFYLILQMSYSKLGDPSKQYYYSSRFRVIPGKQFTFRGVESKIGNSQVDGWWYCVGGNGEVSKQPCS